MRLGFLHVSALLVFVAGSNLLQKLKWDGIIKNEFLKSSAGTTTTTTIQTPEANDTENNDTTFDFSSRSMATIPRTTDSNHTDNSKTTLSSSSASVSSLVLPSDEQIATFYENHRQAMKALINGSSILKWNSMGGFQNEFDHVTINSDTKLEDVIATNKRFVYTDGSLCTMAKVMKNNNNKNLSYPHVALVHFNNDFGALSNPIANHTSGLKGYDNWNQYEGCTHQQILDYISDPNTLAVFTNQFQNIGKTHDKLISVPLGLNRFSARFIGRNLGGILGDSHTDPSSQEQRQHPIRRTDWLMINSKPWVSRVAPMTQILKNFNVPQDMIEASITLEVADSKNNQSSKPFTKESILESMRKDSGSNNTKASPLRNTYQLYKSLDGDEVMEVYLNQMLQSKFIWSPSGLGLDCFRHWEALYLGVIPVIAPSSRLSEDGWMSETLKDLPVAFVEEHDQITPKWLEKMYFKIITDAPKGGYAYEKLTRSYWVKKAKSYLPTDETSVGKTGAVEPIRKGDVQIKNQKDQSTTSEANMPAKLTDTASSPPPLLPSGEQISAFYENHLKAMKSLVNDSSILFWSGTGYFQSFLDEFDYLTVNSTTQLEDVVASKKSFIYAEKSICWLAKLFLKKKVSYPHVGLVHFNNDFGALSHPIVNHTGTLRGHGYHAYNRQEGCTHEQILEYLDDPNTLAVFTSQFHNIGRKHDKVISIPLGLNRRHFYIRLGMEKMIKEHYPPSSPEELQQLHTDWLMINSKPWLARPGAMKQVMRNFNVSEDIILDSVTLEDKSNPRPKQTKESALELLAKKDENNQTLRNTYYIFGSIGNRDQTMELYTNQLSHSKFVWSPSGLGVDCFRLWEALYMGVIPIVATASRMSEDGWLSETLKDLPIAFVEEHHQITPQWLEQTYTKIMTEAPVPGGYAYEKLTKKYWVDKAYSYLPPAKGGGVKAEELEHTSNGDVEIENQNKQATTAEVSTPAKGTTSPSSSSLLPSDAEIAAFYETHLKAMKKLVNASSIMFWSGGGYFQSWLNEFDYAQVNSTARLEDVMASKKSFIYADKSICWLAKLFFQKNVSYPHVGLVHFNNDFGALSHPVANHTGKLRGHGYHAYNGQEGCTHEQILEYLDNPNTLAVFTSQFQNIGKKHDKVISIPLGLNRRHSYTLRRLQSLIKVYNPSSSSPDQQLHTDWLMINSKPWVHRPAAMNQILRNFNVSEDIIVDSVTERDKHNPGPKQTKEKVMELLRKDENNHTPLRNTYYLFSSIGSMDETMDMYTDQLVQSKFVWSPSGLGIDCFRLWEALYLGVIPIVATASRMSEDGWLSETLKDLPIALVEQHDQITPEWLEKTYAKIIKEAPKGGYAYEKLTKSYWVDKAYSYLPAEKRVRKNSI